VKLVTITVIPDVTNGEYIEQWAIYINLASEGIFEDDIDICAYWENMHKSNTLSKMSRIPVSANCHHDANVISGC